MFGRRIVEKYLYYLFVFDNTFTRPNAVVFRQNYKNALLYAESEVEGVRR